MVEEIKVTEILRLISDLITESRESGGLTAVYKQQKMDKIMSSTLRGIGGRR